MYVYNHKDEIETQITSKLFKNNLIMTINPLKEYIRKIV